MYVRARECVCVCVCPPIEEHTLCHVGRGGRGKEGEGRGRERGREKKQQNAYGTISEDLCRY